MKNTDAYQKDRLVPIGEAARLTGTSASTLRRWEKEGSIPPAGRTKGGQRRYLVSSLPTLTAQEPDRED